MESKRAADPTKMAEVSELLRLKENDVKRLAKLNEALVQQCENYMRTMATMKAEHEAAVDALQQQCGKKDELIASMRHNRTTTGGFPAASMPFDAQSVTDLQTALLSADNEVKAQIRARLEVEANLKRTTEELRTALRVGVAKEEKLRTSEDTLQKLTAENQSLYERLSALRAMNEQYSKSIATLEAKLKTADEEIRTCRANTALVNSLQKRLNSLHASLESLKKENERLVACEEHSTKLQAEKSTLLELVAKLKHSLAQTEQISPAGTQVPAPSEPQAPKAADSRTRQPSTLLAEDAGGELRKTAKESRIPAGAASSIPPHAAEAWRRKESDLVAEKQTLQAKVRVLNQQNEELQSLLGQTQLDLANCRQNLAFLEAAATAKASGPDVVPLSMHRHVLQTLQQEREAHERQLVEVESVVKHLAQEQAAVESTIRRLQEEKELAVTSLQALTLERDSLRRALADFATSQVRSASRAASVSPGSTDSSASTRALRADMRQAGPVLDAQKLDSHLPALATAQNTPVKADHPPQKTITDARRTSAASALSSVTSNSRALDQLLENIQSAKAVTDPVVGDTLAKAEEFLVQHGRSPGSPGRAPGDNDSSAHHR